MSSVRLRSSPCLFTFSSRFGFAKDCGISLAFKSGGSGPSIWSAQIKGCQSFTALALTAEENWHNTPFRGDAQNRGLGLRAREKGDNFEPP